MAAEMHLLKKFNYRHNAFHLYPHDFYDFRFLIEILEPLEKEMQIKQRLKDRWKKMPMSVSFLVQCAVDAG